MERFPGSPGRGFLCCVYCKTLWSCRPELCFPFRNGKSALGTSKEISIPLALALFSDTSKGSRSGALQNAFPESSVACCVRSPTGWQFASITPCREVGEELAGFVFQHWRNRFLLKLHTINCIKSFQQGFHGYVKAKSYSNCFK